MFILKWHSSKSCNLFWIAECFVFREKVSRSFVSPLHANTNQNYITNFKPLGSVTIWRLLRPKSFSSIQFTNLKRLELKKAISSLISTSGLFVDESRELLPPNLNFARFLATFAHKKSIKERIRRSLLKNNPKGLTVIM